MSDLKLAKGKVGQVLSEELKDEMGRLSAKLVAAGVDHVMVAEAGNNELFTAGFSDLDFLCECGRVLVRMGLEMEEKGMAECRDKSRDN